MPSNASIFLTLVAGFVFLGLFDLTRYLSQGWNGPRLVFGAGTFGTLLVLAAAALEGLRVPYLEVVLLWMSEATGAGGDDTSIPPHVVLALMLALALPLALNLVTPRAGLAAVSRRYGGNRLLLFLGREFDLLITAAKAASSAEARRDKAESKREQLKANKRRFGRVRAERSARRAMQKRGRLLGIPVQ